MKWFSGEVTLCHAWGFEFDSFNLCTKRARTSSSGSSLTFILWCSGTYAQNKCDKKFKITKMYLRSKSKKEQTMNLVFWFRGPWPHSQGPSTEMRKLELLVETWEKMYDYTKYREFFLAYFYFACRSVLPVCVCTYALCMYAYMYVHCMHKMPMEARRGHQSPWNWSYSCCVEIRIQTQALWQNGKGS